MMLIFPFPLALSLSKCADRLEASFDRLRTNGISAEVRRG